jgi:hypothetical protein
MTPIDGNVARNLPLRPECETRTRLVLVEHHAILQDGLKSLLDLLFSRAWFTADSRTPWDCFESSLEGIRQLQPVLPGGFVGQPLQVTSSHMSTLNFRNC